MYIPVFFGLLRSTLLFVSCNLQKLLYVKLYNSVGWFIGIGSLILILIWV